MPVSSNLLDGTVKNDIESLKPKRIFDVGVGYGKMGKIIRSLNYDCEITGFEFYKQHIEENEQEINKNYDKIIIGDFYDWLKENVDWDVDLIIFGDSLEHSFKSIALDMVDMCEYRTKWLMMTIPLDYWNVNHEKWPRKEAHISNLKMTDFVHYNIIHYLKVDFMTYYLIKGKRR